MRGEAAPSVFIRELAQRQLRDYCAAEPGRFFGEDHAALAIEEAYAIQDEVARLRVAGGDAIAGFKIGCIGPKILEQFGMSGPIGAILYRSEVHRSGVTLLAGLYAGLAVEGEVAVRLDEDGEIRSAFPVIELHNFVFRAPRKTLVELVANNGLNCGIVIPEGVEPPFDGDAADSGVLSLSINGAEVDRGSPWAMAGGAETAVAWLRQHLADRGRALEGGHVVLTGTPLGLHPVRPGDVIRVAWTSHGEVEATVRGESLSCEYDSRGVRPGG